MMQTATEPFGSRYLLGGDIGVGATGTVRVATEREGDRRVAIKILHPQYARDSAAIGRFLAEQDALEQIRHPNVVSVLDLVVDGGRIGIVMEHVDGGTLRDLPTTSGNLTRAEMLILHGVTTGLAAVHDAGFIHRDLKPANILMAGSGGPTVPKITDFGLAKLQSSNDTGQSGAVGTPLYMAPETVDSSLGSIGTAIDVYALGVIMYEMATGRRPYDYDNKMKVLYAHASEEIPRLDGVHPTLADLNVAMLAKRSADRPTLTEIDGTLTDHLDLPAGAVSDHRPDPTVSRTVVRADDGSDRHEVIPLHRPPVNPALGPPPAARVSTTMLRQPNEPRPVTVSTGEADQPGRNPLLANEPNDASNGAGPVIEAGGKRSRRTLALLLAVGLLGVAAGGALVFSRFFSGDDDPAIAAEAGDLASNPGAPLIGVSPTADGEASESASLMESGLLARQPGQPENVRATSGEDRQVRVSWRSPAEATEPLEYQIRIAGEPDSVTPVGTATRYTWLGLRNDQRYRFEVRAGNVAGWSEWTESNSATPEERDDRPGTVRIPGAPLGLAASAGLDEITWSWAAPSDDGGGTVTSYEVERSDGGGETAAGTAYTWTGLSTETAYGLQVRACNDAGCGPLSAIVEATTRPDVTTPGIPTSFDGDGGPTSVALRWTAPDDGGSPITGYVVEMGAITNDATTTSFTWTGLDQGTSYTFRVRACNAAGCGATSQPMTRSTTGGGIVEPSAPVGLSLIGSDVGQVTLGWSPPADDGGSPITSYTLQRSGGGEVQVPNGTSHTWTGLAGGRTSQFRVQACNTAGCGPFTAWFDAEPATNPPGQPGGLTANPSTTEITLTWNPPADDGGATITRYEIEREGGSGASASTTTSTVSGLDPDTPYRFRVRACHTECGAFTAWLDVRTDAPPPPSPDINGDGEVDQPDLDILFSDWQTTARRSDLNQDGIVNILDLSILLAAWTGDEEPDDRQP